MKRRRVLLYAALIAAVYFAVFGGEYGLFHLWRLERWADREAVELEALREEVVRLRARVDSLEHDNAVLERLARESFGLVRPGERLYRFVEPGDSVRVEAAASN